MSTDPDYFDIVVKAARDNAQASRIRALDTPIIRDMRTTARELGIVEALLEHQRIVYQSPAKAHDLVEDALIRLGVTAAEQLANLELAEVDAPAKPVPYLVDAERALRPEAMRSQYQHQLRFQLKGRWYIRWFRTVEDRAAYRRNLPPSIIEESEER